MLTQQRIILLRSTQLTYIPPRSILLTHTQLALTRQRIILQKSTQLTYIPPRSIRLRDILRRFRPKHELKLVLKRALELAPLELAPLELAPLELAPLELAPLELAP
ncbi:hypothetical protein RJZ57_007497 [Blastomyces gilchristii]